MNQDGSVNTLDLNQINNKSAIFATGYIPEDGNGDGTIDALDLTLIDNNAIRFIGKQTP